MNCLNMARVSARMTTEPPFNRSRSGYGSKLPTAYMLKLDGRRWHRVYMVCWSNAGTAYVIERGKPVYIATGDL